jgi:hypothetical protein
VGRLQAELGDLIVRLCCLCLTEQNMATNAMNRVTVQLAMHFVIATLRVKVIWIWKLATASTSERKGGRTFLHPMGSITPVFTQPSTGDNAVYG